MLKKLMPVAALLALSACYNEDKYADDMIEASCNYLICGDTPVYPTVEECVTAMNGAEGADTTGCTFNVDTAKACVDAWNALTCDSDAAAVTAAGTACADVYTDCPAPEGTTTK